MKLIVPAFLTALAGAALPAATVHAAPAAPGPAAKITPKLAANVKPAATGYEAPTERLVAANPTPIFSDHFETSMPTGQALELGEPVQAIAKVSGWDWLLVGKGGVGIGYVPRSLLKPAGT